MVSELRNIDLSIEWSSTSNIYSASNVREAIVAASTAIRQERRSKMEIYEADSRINAAAYRTAFRAMGRAFFRSCPHFTINGVFFRLL